jgi:hypothetical protein
LLAAAILRQVRNKTSPDADAAMVTTSAAVKTKSITLFPATHQETEISMSYSHTGAFVFISTADVLYVHMRGIGERYQR